MKHARLSILLSGTLMMLLGVVAVGVRDVAGTDVAPWKKFTSPAEHLSVLMPGVPAQSEKHNQSFVGDIITIVHTAKQGSDTYTIDYTSLPGFAITFSGKDGIYSHARNAVLAGTFSKSISYTDLTLNGIEGKKLVYDTPSKPGHPEMQGEARFFLVDHHLYTVDAVVQMNGAEAKLERFFASLQITK